MRLINSVFFEQPEVVKSGESVEFLKMESVVPPADLEDLYQEIILDHTRHPRNEGEISPCRQTAEGFNPLCGDRVRVFLADSENSTKIQFTASGCAISRASASILTELLADVSPENFESHSREILEYLNAHSDSLPGEFTSADSMKALAAVRNFPARIKCATLPWNTLLAALKK